MQQIAVLFPGQGSQMVGMGRDVAEASPLASEVYRRADDILGFELSRCCFEGPAEKLECTDVQQPAIFVTSVAIWEALQIRGVLRDRVAAAAGLSLGEYTALYVAGAMSFEDALRLVYRRGQLMQEASEAQPGGMVSLVGADAVAVSALCARASEGEVLVPANFNCPGQIVISGTRAACERAIKLAEEFDCRAVSLKVAGAFHSPLMESAASGLAEALRSTRISPPRIRVLANVNALYHTDPDSIRTALRDQVTHPVQWLRSMERLIAEGCEPLVEVGTGRVLTGLAAKINRKVRRINIGSAADLNVELEEVLVA
jgi:[acyl-carrier-protein] S-malonyltransferase